MGFSKVCSIFFSLFVCSKVWDIDMLTIPRYDFDESGFRSQHLVPSISDELFAYENPVFRVEMCGKPGRDSYICKLALLV